MDITKQQLAKLSERMEALAKEHTEVAGKGGCEANRACSVGGGTGRSSKAHHATYAPPTPPPSQAPRGHSSPRVSDVASSGMAVDAELLLASEGEENGPKSLRVGATGEEAPSVQQVLAAQETFSTQELESIMESFRQRHSLLEQELIASEQRDLEVALGWSV